MSGTLVKIRAALGLAPADVEALLGPDFDRTNAERMTRVYRFARLGFTIAFSTRNAQGIELAEQASIESPDIDLYGTRLGMAFSEIMRLRGKTDMRSAFVADDNIQTYYIAYSRDGVNIIYDSGSPPGQPPTAQIITITKSG